MSDGWIELFREALKVPGLLKEIYGDLLKPGVKQAGKALETVVGLGNTVLWPVTLANERARIALEKNLEKYRLQMAEVPEDKVTSVPPEIGVPISEKLTYVTDESLSDLYINLLAKASTRDTSNQAHPSFVNIIDSLSPDEALLIGELYRRMVLAFVEVRLTKKGANEWNTQADLLTMIEYDTNLVFKENTVAYLSNFEGLGLIKIRRDVLIANPPLYDRLEAMYRPVYESQSWDRNTFDLSFERGKVEVTPFGLLFMKACLTKIG